MRLNETISTVSKGKSFTIFIIGQLFLSMAKTPGRFQWSLTAMHVFAVCTGGCSCITHPATLDTCSLGRATLCHNTYTEQKSL